MIIGQGRPILWQLLLALLWPGLALAQPTLGDRAAHSDVTSQEAPQAPVLRLRVSWGGSNPDSIRTWRGVLSLSDGHLASPQSLGYEADEPGSMWIDNGRLHIEQRSMRINDAVDVDVFASLDAVLTIALSPRDGGQEIPPVELRLADVVTANFVHPLDQHGSRLEVRRAPGDVLRVKLPRDMLVLRPSELLELQVQPHLIGVAEGTSVLIKSQLQKARTAHILASQEHKAVVSGGSNTGAAAQIQLEAPAEEGVYELALEATQPGLLRWNRPWSKSLADRRLQFVVISPESTTQTGSATWTEVAVIDAANPKFWDRIKLSRIPGLQRAPLNNGSTQTWQHSLGQMMQLGPGGAGSQIAWEGYTLPVSRPGIPHLLEVEYPSDVPQTLGISILEPNAAGEIVPGGLDSGFYVGDEIAPGAPKLRKHRLLFWPRTKTPLVLLTNRRDGSQAAYGKIRLLSGPDRLPSALPPSIDAEPKRLVAGYYNRPLFTENFSASELLDRSGRSLDDWQTFYEGASRLVDYLNHTGQNGLMLSVLASGSTLYPSTLIEPTPRYDTGAFIAQGADPVRKDVLEMVLQLFDRERLRLIPSVHFTAPLPKLEALLRDRSRDSTGILLTGPDGRPWNETRPSDNGQAAYYNPLNKQVQHAMAEVILELVERYGQHTSFAGLGVELSAASYSQLPSEQWALDDLTISEFARDTGADLPFIGPDRFAQRAAALSAQGPLRDQWLQWRSAKLAIFYRTLAARVKAAQPGAKLYLTGAAMFDDVTVTADLRPTLPPGKLKFDDLLARIGFQSDDYPADSGVVLLSPRRLRPHASLAAEGVDLQLNVASAADRRAESSFWGGSLLFHEPQKTRLESFDARSPFGPGKTYTMLVSQMSPSATAGRRRFVQSLTALDSQAIVDGGWLLPLGQEEAVRDCILAYRRLPAEPFTTLAGVSRPIAVRTHKTPHYTYVYFVNDSAWSAMVTTSVTLPTGCAMEELSGLRMVAIPADSKWSVTLDPYDFVAVRFTSPHVQLAEPAVQWQNGLQEHLAGQVRDFGARVALLASAAPLSSLANASFEQPPGEDAPIPSWMTLTPHEETTVQLDTGTAADGGVSVCMRSTGAVVSLCSEIIEAPKTGRVDAIVALKTRDAGDRASLRIAFEGLHNGEYYYRFGEIRAENNMLDTSWKHFSFAIDDLPPEGLTNLRIRIDLMGAGEVWVDDFQVYDLKFLHDKHRELLKIVASADSQLNAGNIGGCITLLGGYWPRYLQANVPLSQLPAPTAEVATRPRAPEPAPEKPGMLDRIRGVLRF